VLAEREAAPRCRRTALAVDLRTDWAGRLTGAGFDPAAPTAWLAEGLLVYLTVDAAAGLLTSVGELSAPGSRLACERGNVVQTARPEASPSMEEFTSLWKGGLGPDAADWLARNGWRARVHDLESLAASYGRPVSTRSRSGFVTATRSAR
jgi:methyltransferase (TIGR00027 family)